MQGETQNQMQDCQMGMMHTVSISVHTAEMNMPDMAEQKSATEHHDSNSHMHMDCCDESTSMSCCEAEC